jgi:hypothetical protein
VVVKLDSINQKKQGKHHMQLSKFSMGIGDRFGCQGEAQLRALMEAGDIGIHVTPIWNKSEREHTIIGTSPEAVRDEADAAVKNLGWTGDYRVDADHINEKIVDRYLQAADFFTLDVAEDIGGGDVTDAEIQNFLNRHGNDLAILEDAGLGLISTDEAAEIACKYLPAVKAAGRIYRRIATAKGEENFIAEISMDETEAPQTPPELFLILAALAEEGIMAQTIAPKFSGRFNKGVEYVGDVGQFTKEFNADIQIVALAVEHFNLPKNLKLSVHSGSDKFSIYAPIREAIARHGAGLHLKTAGTTWLEEIAGLARAGGEGLALAKEIYAEALAHFDELCAPYASVIDINPANLPAVETVNGWDSDKFVATVRHNQDCSDYNSDARQLLHVGYKIAAKMGDRYLDLLRANEQIVGDLVAENIFNHAVQVFPK